ncbi:hypothetical protein G210_3837, partial [Candida maltosa Xu316]
MSSRSEIQKILSNLETTYTSDLAIHLYSTFLLHQINPKFPRKSWTRWPLPKDQVPIPEDKYEDDIVDDFPTDITDEINHEQELVNINLSLPIIDIEYKSRSVDSKKVIVNSISSIIQRKIMEKISEKRQVNGDFECSDRISSNPALKPISLEIMTKLDSMLDSLSHRRRRRRRNKDWRDVLVSTVKSEIDPYKVLNTRFYRKLYSTCSALFDDFRYKFEFEDEDNVVVLEEENDEDEVDARDQKKIEFF